MADDVDAKTPDTITVSSNFMVWPPGRDVVISDLSVGTEILSLYEIPTVSLFCDGSHTTFYPPVPGIVKQSRWQKTPYLARRKVLNCFPGDDEGIFCSDFAATAVGKLAVWLL